MDFKRAAFNAARAVPTLLLSLAAIPLAQSAEPLAAWDCGQPSDLALGERVDVSKRVFEGSGSVQELRSVRILPPEDHGKAADCKAFWTPAEGGGSALSLSQAMARSIYAPADRAAILECGGKLQTPLKLSSFSLCVKFKTTGKAPFGGGNPPWELDGKLLSLGPSIELGVTGTGGNGREPRRPFLQLKGASGGQARLVAERDAEIPIGQWRTLLLAFSAPKEAGTQPAVSLWIDGKSFKLELSGGGQIPSAFEVAGPLRVGGDRSWGNIPVELGGFAVFGEAVDWSAAVETLGSKSFERFGKANLASSWTVSGKGVELIDNEGKGVSVKFSEEALGAKTRLLLKEPLNVEGGDCLQFWHCMPITQANDFGNGITAIFSDAKGGETLVNVAHCVSTHIAPGNSRKAGVWALSMPEISAKKGVSKFLGLEFTYEIYSGDHKWKVPSTLCFRDFGVDRTDYSKARLYYVAGNCAGNFSIQAFNYCQARALTDVTGGTPLPFISLDNAVDQAKNGRPKILDLSFEAYDSSDKRVWAGSLKGVPAADVFDFARKIEIPLSEPGTYKVKSKSYDSASGQYFTTEWSQLVIVRGFPGKAFDEASLPKPALSINPDKAFGRLEKTDAKKIDFHVGELKGDGPFELKYRIQANSRFIPGRAAVRPEPMETSVPLTATPCVTSVPHEPKSAVELVVVELWAGGKRVDREERLFGVENGLDKAPELDKSAGILDLKQSLQPGGVWMNSQFHSLVDSCGEKSLEVMEKSLDDAKAISPFVGFSPPLDLLEPMPGVYDWDYLKKFFDLAAAHGCRLVLYISEKYPMPWAPVDFFQNEKGKVHQVGIVWGHLVGGYNYATGLNGPAVFKEFNKQLARRFLNHPGFGAYYFENEHLVSDGSTSLPSSRDPGNKASFAEFLKGRYKSVTELNDLYGTRYSSFQDVQLPDSNVVKFPKKAMHADFLEYFMHAAERYITDCQFDAVRKEDPVRPIIIYAIGMSHAASAPFYQNIARNGGLMANGGVHSLIDSDNFRETYASIPGLLERMEPHDMWHYEPFPYGLDDMIFGMLSVGGRGMNFHFFLNALPWAPFSLEKFKADRSTGYVKLMERFHAIKEMAPAEKLHDAVGIMDLRKAYDYCLSFWTSGARPLMAGVYVRNHYEPKIYHPGMELSWLDGSKAIFITGELIDKGEREYLKAFLERGGCAVLQESDAAISFERPDDDSKHCLLSHLGVDPSAPGAQIPGLAAPHDVYSCGKGRVAVVRMRAPDWGALAPPILKWSDADARIADSDDPFMQTHVLQGPDAYYVAIAHRGFDQNAYNGPKEWSGNVRFHPPAGAQGPFEVSSIWGAEDVPLGKMSAAQLSKGFDAGKFSELQMKVFRVKPASMPR